MALTRIFYASDVHGSEICFKKFTNAWKFYKADVIILGGDLTGKMVIPAIREEDGTFTVEFMGVHYRVKTLEELEVLEMKIRDTGYYPYRTNPKEMEELETDEAKVDELFSRLMIETMEKWARMAEERLKSTNVKCFITPGNDDRLAIDSVLKGLEHIVNPEGKVVWIDDDHEIITTGYSNVTPWKCPRDILEEELAEKIEVMAAQVKDMKNCIFNFHCPPFNSGIDAAPELSKSLEPRTGIGGISTVPVGSMEIRKAIERYQPLLGLHGHIHESAGAVKIGRTLCVNPGSEYGEGILRGIIINLDEKGIKSYLPVRG